MPQIKKPRKPLDPNDAQAVFSLTREAFDEAQQLFAGITDRVPEGFRNQFSTLKGKLDNVLRQMAAAPTEQIPAAQEGAYALNHMASCLQWFEQMYGAALESIDKLVGELGPKATQLQQLQGRIESKELLGGDDLQAHTKKAVDDALTKERARLTLLGQRRQVLASASLPVPVEDAVLEGEEKDFTARKDSAAARIKQLGDEGIEVSQLNGAQLSNLAYGPKEGFETLLAMYRGARGKTTTELPEEPLLKGKGETPADKTNKGSSKTLLF